MYLPLSMQAASTTDYKILFEQERKEKEALKIEVLKMQMQLQKFAQMLFGSTSERFKGKQNDPQLSLDIDVEESPAAFAKEQLTEVKAHIKTAKGAKKRQLDQLSVYMNNLPRVYETREPAEKPEGVEKIGEDRYESIEYTPGKMFVKVTIVPKYKVAGTKEHTFEIISAPAPVRPLGKCLAGASMLAQSLVDKYADHLPVYRQQGRFARDGTNIPYNTLLDWNAGAIDLIEILYQAQRKLLLRSNYIHADETGLKVICGPETQKYRKVHDGYLWCYHNSIARIVYFEYQHGRGQKNAIGMLQDFYGVLQTDGWDSYKSIADKIKTITIIFCMAHARRKFKEAEQYDEQLAAYALIRFQQLYEVERHCREQQLTYDDIKKVRQEKSVLILNELHKWMKEQYAVLLPSSPIRKAIAYALNHWEGLCHYTTDGKLNIDNNPVENSIRPVALGRKNFLFAGSEKGAHRIAVIYSLIGTCKLHNINPYEWLKDVLDRIQDYSVNKIEDLLPQNWKNMKR